MMIQDRRSRAARLLLSSALGGIALAACLPAFAAEAEKEKMEEIVVTGSNLPTTPDAVANTVSILDADALLQEGVGSNVLDAMRKAMPQFTGRANAGNSNSTNTNQLTAGGSMMELRNLDTLVLINGRRAAISAIAGIGGKLFVDVNQIPTSAIERIEVLSDGSSAIYGSDAIGGVVNIILKSDAKGTEVGTRLGTTGGGFNQRSEYFTTGQKIGGFNLTISGSDSHSTPLWERDRSFASPTPFSLNNVYPGSVNGSAGTYVLAPGVTSPAQNNPTGTAATATNFAPLVANGTYVPTTTAGLAKLFDLSQYRNLLFQQNQRAINASFDYDFLRDRRLVLFGDLEYARTDSTTQFAPLAQATAVPAGSPYDPLRGAVPGVNFGQLDRPETYNNFQDAVRFTLGLRGELGKDWSWETAVVHSENTLSQKQNNLIFKPNLARLIAGGYDANGNVVAGGAYSQVYAGPSTANPFAYVPALDPFSRKPSAAALAYLYGSEDVRALSFLNSFDAKLVGTIGELPAGEPGFAIGGQVREEGLRGRTTDDPALAGSAAGAPWFGGLAKDPFSRSRTVDAGFAELRTPITGPDWNVTGLYAFDLIGAIRTEHYTDAGWSTVPKVSLRWQPLDKQLTIRASESKAFTAPPLYQEASSPSFSTKPASQLMSVLGLTNVTSGYFGEDAANPRLRPSKTLTRSLSATATPNFLPDFKFTAEYSDIKQDGFFGGTGVLAILDSVNRLGAASPYVGQLSLNNYPGLAGATYFSAPGQLKSYLLANPGGGSNLYSVDYFLNQGGVRVKSTTLNANYIYTLSDQSSLTLDSVANIFNSYKYQPRYGARWVQYAGTASNSGTIGGTIPRFQLYSTLGWTYDVWSASVSQTYIPPVTDNGADRTATVPLASKTIKAYQTFDLRFAYTGGPILGDYGKGVSIAFGINNVFDKMPPLDQRTFTDTNADTATYSPIGRFYYTQASVKF